MPPSSQSVNPALLLEPSFSAHTRARLGPDGVIRVSIEGASEADRQWIQALLARIDGLIAPDLVVVADPAQALLRLIQVADRSGIEGISLPVEQGWEVRWQAAGPGGLLADPNARHTIVHELMHPLGLGHPGGNALSKRYSTATTVLSYRRGPKGWNDWLSSADQAALQQVWTPEASGEPTISAVTSRGLLRVAQAQLQQAPALGGLLQGSPGSDWLTGGPGDDQLLGDAGADVLIGGAGSDRIVPGPGADIVTSCRDGALDRLELTSRPARGAIPLVEALEPIDRLMLSGAAGRRVSVAASSLDGLSGLGVFVDRRLAVLVADPWLTRQELSGMLELA